MTVARLSSLLPAAAPAPASGPERGAEPRRSRCGGWSLPDVAGRLVEVSGGAAGAALTLTVRLVLDAQRRGEPVAWVGRQDSFFFPPDVAEAGVDLSALPVVRAPDLLAAAEAAELLLRSAAFGLVVLDIGADSRLPLHIQTRLAALARRHEAAVVCLTEKEDRLGSLGPLVSLRAAASRAGRHEDLFRCEVRILKDKRAAPGWSYAEVCRAPDGVC